MESAKAAGNRRNHNIVAKVVKDQAPASHPESQEQTPYVQKHQAALQFQSAGHSREIQAATLQFVRKVSGFNKPSKANEAAFALAVEEIACSAAALLHSLETTAPAKNRDEEAAKAELRSAQRFAD